MTGPSEDTPADQQALREQVMRLLRVEADLFRRNEQLDAQWKIYRSLSDLGKQFQGRLSEQDIATAVVHFALYSLNLERAVLGLRDGTHVRVVARDGYYEDAHAQTIAALCFGSDHPLFDAPGDRQRLRGASESLSERDAIARTFDLDEYAWLPLRESQEAEPVGFFLAGNTATKAQHHGRIIADDPVVLALENLVDLTSAALRGVRLAQALQAERNQLEQRVEQRTKEREELLSEIIQVQQQRLTELSTPILPIAEHILVMPLIGTMDARRSVQLQSAALHGAAMRRTRFVILDVTGAKAVDITFARALLQTAGALRLLGVRVVITGVRPEMARVLVELDTRLETLVTHTTLQRGIAYAMSNCS